jgi:hypothetical protein
MIGTIVLAVGALWILGIAASPDPVSVGQRGAVTTGWRAGRDEAYRRWQAGASARNKRRIRRERTWSRSRTGRVALTGEQFFRHAGWPAVTATGRGLLIVVPAVAAGVRAAPQGWRAARQDNTAARSKPADPAIQPEENTRRASAPQTPEKAEATEPEPLPRPDLEPERAETPDPMRKTTGPATPPSSTTTGPEQEQSTTTGRKSTVHFGDISDHTTLRRLLSTQSEEMEDKIAKLRKLLDEIEDSSDEALGTAHALRESMHDDRFGSSVQKAAEQVTEMANRAREVLSGFLASGRDDLPKAFGEVTEAADAAENAAAAAVGD